MGAYIQGCRISKNIIIHKTNYYNDIDQRLIGFTITKEKYEILKETEFCFNLWLWWIGLHLTIKRKNKSK